MKIQLKSVLKGVGSDSPLSGLHRVLWVQDRSATEEGFIVTIQIPTRTKGTPPVRYWKSPERHSLDAVMAAIEQSTVVQTKIEMPPLVHLTDDQIRRRYPQRSTATKRRHRTDCAPLQTRDRLWTLVEPLVSYVEDHPAQMYRPGAISPLVKERALQTRRSRAEILNALNRYLALACGRNSLLAATLWCGAANQPRSPSTKPRLGRKNTAYLKGLWPSPGVHLTEKDKCKINLGWSTFLRNGHSVKAAHILTLGTWWSSGTKVENGVELPVLLPPDQRPTLRQFRYWGPRQEDGRSAFELLLRPNEWNKKYRPMLGTALDGISGVGQIGLMDSTSTDQTLVSMISPLEAVGTCNRNVIHDGLSDVICGVYCGFEAPSPMTAMLTVLNAASDKVDFCRRFGLDITLEQFPSLLFRVLRIDNGEMRAQQAIELMKSVGTALEFVERDRPERKGPTETGHKSLHRVLDRRGDGRTNGRQRARGEDHSAVKACWIWYVYVRELLLAIRYHNCVADASALYDRHPFRTEMLRDKVPPNRAAIHAWCIKQSRISAPYCDLALLRAMVLPVTRAVVQQNGVFLLRPDRGRKNEMLRSARFSGPRATELGWHKGTSKPLYVDVRYDPNNLECVWYSDELGMHRLSNLSSDPVLKRQGTLVDYLDLQDRQGVEKLRTQQDRDQGLSDVVSHIEATNLKCRTAKQEAIKATGRKVSKAELVANIKDNRRREIELLSGNVDPITRAPLDSVSNSTGDSEPKPPLQSQPQPKEDMAEKTFTDPVAEELATYRKQRGTK